MQPEMLPCLAMCDDLGPCVLEKNLPEGVCVREELSLPGSSQKTRTLTPTEGRAEKELKEHLNIQLQAPRGLDGGIQLAQRHWRKRRVGSI